VVSIYPDHASRPDPEELPPPTSMTPSAKRIWNEKVSRYRRRGQKVQGFEDALRQFCELEAALNKAWKNGTATMAMVNAHRLWSAEFFDTPSSQKVPAGHGRRDENKFAKNGHRARA
jgi:hypothetical protein